MHNLIKQCISGFYFISKYKSIFHRDIKPENILLKNNNIIKITDFGVSRELLEKKYASMTLVGTPIYFSPLLWDKFVSKNPNSKVHHDLEKSDVFSLGLTFL